MSADYDRGRADGVVSERARIDAILSHPDAKRPETQAQAAHLAFKTDLSIEDAHIVMRGPAASVWDDAIATVNAEFSGGATKTLSHGWGDVVSKINRTNGA